MIQVLIADDSLFIRTNIREILLSTGRYEVAGEARNGREAVDLYEQRRPEIVTMDIVMPELDGIGAIEEIVRRHPGAAIIVCSSLGQEALVSECLTAGARDFIVKPITVEKLLPVLDRCRLR